MCNSVRAVVSLLILISISTASFGQAKQITITRPSQLNSKEGTRQGVVLTPQAGSGRVSAPASRFIKENGSFLARFRQSEKKNERAVVKEFQSGFNLNEFHHFQQSGIRKDERNVTHTQYQQYYKGLLVEQGAFLLHSNNDAVTSGNGKIAEFSDLEVQITVSAKEAIQIAQSYLKVDKVINEYPVETVIIKIPGNTNAVNKVAHKVRIDSYDPFVMCHVYVDAKTGEVIQQINLIAHIDAPSTARTLYSGTQSITTDLSSGSYRLRENVRRIETYDATDATGLTTSGFTNSVDFTNSSATWPGVFNLSSIAASSVLQSWWFTSFSDELPDLYFKVKDVAGRTVFVSNDIIDTSPPIEVKNLNIILNHPPYTLEIWDRDISGGDDFGGSYPLALKEGTQSWGGNGNTGTYTINTIGNPALDIHWGMEKTYDFYHDIFNRNSYDGKGNVIRQYLNPPVYQQGKGGDPNNAGAQPPPYNLMQYGMGDNQLLKPVVALDVEGHEFTHMVIYNSIFDGSGHAVGLTYSGESGALNESFADIFGVGVEFYVGSDPDWVVGEDLTLTTPFLRSLSNPNSMGQPDTYKGQLWMDATNIPVDHGGVHTNSGVQNFWFYLLSEGGTGTNDLGNAYAVTGIGLAQAQQIAYRNLTTQLLPNATYMDAYLGSLQAAEDLYGNPSAQYTAVRQAWYAVGIGSDPSNYCSGLTVVTDLSGIITDGSGEANYNSNANCRWRIAPAGATQITLSFTEFDTQAEGDTVIVYDGPDNSSPVLAKWWGNVLPPVIQTTSGKGAMFIEFKSDSDLNANGWSASYTSSGINPGCNSGSVLSATSATFGDGSESSDYGNNQLCYWFIAPPCATSISLSFSEFNTEKNQDIVAIYSDLEQKNQITALSGSDISGSITSNTGKMLVVFSSDYSNTRSGFIANYTSTGSAQCSGTTRINTSDSGSITDGSGNENYCNNADCQWVIQPPDAETVSLNFSAFDVEPASPDGLIIYDAVEVYDGETTAAPLIALFTGDNIPSQVTSSGGSMLIRFRSDLTNSGRGWTANYTSNQYLSCSGITILNETTGNFSDGSGPGLYSNNSNCGWLIQPPDIKYITLSFSEFNTESKNDGIIVYDGPDNSSPELGRFSGSAIPSSVTAQNGSMYVEFITGSSQRGEGWTANYTSSLVTGIKPEYESHITVFPNPAHKTVSVTSDFELPIQMEIFDVMGKSVSKQYLINKGSNQPDISHLTKGIYLLRFKTENIFYTTRLFVN